MFNNNYFNPVSGFVCFLLSFLLVCSAVPVLAENDPLTTDASALIQQDRVNINKADAQTLAKALNGIGLSKAKAIVAWRETNGTFSNMEQLLAIKGIGSVTLEKNKDHIVL
jgi:competence protein ComEA